jgi:acetylornithine/N-succinyldiaminopimelate aminotransferase
MSAILPTYARSDLAFIRGEGAFVFTADDEAYLDFAAGVAVNALGHDHPHLVDALTAQAEKLWHVSNLYRIEGQERLAERLCAATFADKAFFANSGAEAVECAIKMARKYHAAQGDDDRFRLITFEGAFHGRTLATLAAAGNQKYLDGFGPAADGFDQVPLGDLAAVEAAIGPATAGILIEPVQGEGGIRHAGFSFLRALRALCDEHGILLVLDEVQSGMGRTGHLLAIEGGDIEPDIAAIAKAMGGGFPIGACLATDDAAQGMVAGSHGSTFGGNPLAMAVGNAVLDILLEDGFMQAVRDKGLLFKQKLAGIADRFPDVIAGVRGEGLMLGLECKITNIDLVKALERHHLLAVGAGENVVRFVPPLIVSEAEIDQAMDAIEHACNELSAGS